MMGNSKKQVLLIEDDKDIRETIQEFLETEGYEVTIAENGKEGLEQLKEMKHPCLILLDLFMPIMNGRDFLEKLKTENADIVAGLPVVVLTAAPKGEAEKSLQEGAKALVRKPIDLEGFIKVVEQYCH